MSVADTVVPVQPITWDELTRVAPLRCPAGYGVAWPARVEAAGRDARKALWLSGNKSPELILNACVRALSEHDSNRGDNNSHLSERWCSPLCQSLKDDITLLQHPTLDGVVFMIELIEEWWAKHWEQQDKSDLETILSMADATIEWQYFHWHNAADALLGRLLWLERLRKQFPGYAVTQKELSEQRYRRRVLKVGEAYSTGLGAEVRQVFFEALEGLASGKLHVPVNSDAIEEARFYREIVTVGLGQVERCRLAAALLQTAAALNSERCLTANNVLHPIHGYTIVFGDPLTGNDKQWVGVAPGRWRLRVEGEQYVVTCDLWPRPVVMSHHEFGRARGSANAILRDIGISVDSPPGHWKAVWEKYGLRNQLLAAAERVDQRLRVQEVWQWVARIAAAAPAAHRPAIDGSAVRLADGATVVDRRWLIEQALADGVILPHEEAKLEKEIRRRAKETNRRDEAKRQRKLLVLDAAVAPAEIPLIDTRESVATEKCEGR